MTMNPQGMDLDAVSLALQRFLDGLIAHGGFKLKIEIKRTAGQFERDYENPDLVVAFDGADANLLLENRAELLRSFEQVAMEAVGLDHDSHERVFFDCQDYRQLRIQELGLAAQAAADRVKRTGVPYKFASSSGAADKTADYSRLRRPTTPLSRFPRHPDEVGSEWCDSRGRRA